MEIKIVKGDITKLEVGAIINATDEKMSGGGGVDLAIHRAAGYRLDKECKRIGGCATGRALLHARLRTGKAKITKGYNLPAKYVIHTVGLVYGKENGKEAKLLADCYKNCLKLAKENNIRSIAFPSISTGAYSYLKKEAAKISIAAISEFCAQNPNNFDKIIFTCFDNETYKIYKGL